MIPILLTLLAGAAEDAFEGVGAPPLSDPPTSQSEIDEKTHTLARILRCPVCQGLSVADSREGASLAMKERIREMVAAGYTDEQIIDYFVDRYGEGIVLLPAQRHWMVWLMPVLVLALGGGLVLLRSRSGPEHQVPQSATAEPDAAARDADADDAYREQILAELAED